MKSDCDELVSIILPTFNRAHFLAQAINSICAQEYKYWELIVVDDGSTDNTASELEMLTRNITQEVIYIKQKNSGPAQARNRGIEEAKGDYLAFFDSDDLWLPHHLKICIEALRLNKDVGWIYGACKRVDVTSNTVLCESTFHVDGNNSHFFLLSSKVKGGLNIFTDNRLAMCQLKYGIDCGLQNSVIRTASLGETKIPNFRIGEDRLFIFMAIKAGIAFGYFDDVHTIYNVHENNISDTNEGKSNINKRVSINLELISSYKAYSKYISNLTDDEKKIIRNIIANQYMWILGYDVCWQNGARKEAIKYYICAIKLQPMKIKYWKTLMGSGLKIFLQKIIGMS